MSKFSKKPFNVNTQKLIRFDRLNDLNLIVNLISVVITIIYISYYHHLEKSKCVCAISNEEKYIKYGLYVLLVLNILAIFLPNLLLNNNNRIIKFINIVILFWSVTYYGSLGDWLWKMHKNKCKCTDDWRKMLMEFMYFGWIIIFFVLAILKFIIEKITQ